MVRELDGRLHPSYDFKHDDEEDGKPPAVASAQKAVDAVEGQNSDWSDNIDGGSKGENGEKGALPKRQRLSSE